MLKLDCGNGRSLDSEKNICASIRHKLSFVILCLSILLFLMPIQAHAYGYKSIVRQFEDIHKLGAELNQLSSSAEQRENYSAVSSLGGKYVSELNDLIGILDRVDDSFKDDENKDWGARATRDMIDASKKAYKKAEELKRAGNDKTSSKDEVVELQVALTDLSDDYTDFRERTKKKYEILINDSREKAQKWKSEYQDDDKDYFDALKKFWSLFDEMEKLQAKYESEEKDVSTAIKDYHKTRNSGEARAMSQEFGEAQKAAYESMLYFKKYQAKYKSMEAAYMNMDRAFKKFVDETKQSTTFYTGEVSEAVFRAGDFRDWVTKG